MPRFPVSPAACFMAAWLAASQAAFTYPVVWRTTGPDQVGNPYFQGLPIAQAARLIIPSVSPDELLIISEWDAFLQLWTSSLAFPVDFPDGSTIEGPVHFVFWFPQGSGCYDRIELEVPYTVYEEGGYLVVRTDWPSWYPTKSRSVIINNNLGGSTVMVLDSRLEDSQGHVIWEISKTYYAGAGGDTFSFDLPCFGVRCFARMSPWGSSLDPNAPDTVMPGQWAEILPNSNGDWVIDLFIPFGGDIEGFNVGDKVALRSIPELLGAQNLTGQSMLSELRQIKEKIGGSDGGAGTDILGERLGEWESSAESAGLTNQATFNSWLSQSLSALINSGGSSALSATNLFGSPAGTALNGLSAQVPAVDQPQPDDWALNIKGYQLNLMPWLAMGEYGEPWHQSLTWWFTSVVLIVWWFWAWRQARAFFLQIEPALQFAATSASSSLTGAILRKAGAVFALATASVVAAAVYLVISLGLGWVFNSLFTPGAYLNSIINPPTFFSRIWRMANELVPLAWLLSVSVASLTGMVWLETLVRLVVMVLLGVSSAARVLAPAVVFSVLGCYQAAADWTARVVVPPGHLVVLSGTWVVPDGQQYQLLNVDSGEYVLPDVVGPLQIWATSSQPYAFTRNISPGDTWLIAPLTTVGTNWVMGALRTETRSSWVANQWAIVVPLLGGVFVWFTWRMVRSLFRVVAEEAV